jgi:hypothetical protein
MNSTTTAAALPLDTIRELARGYRADNPARANRGAVILCYGADGWRVVGWNSKPLDEPNRWEPGVLCVFADGDIYQTAGGDLLDGAHRWEKIGKGGAV